MNEAVIPRFFMPVKFASFVILVIVLWTLGVIVLVVQLYRDRYWQVVKTVAKNANINWDMEILKGLYIRNLKRLMAFMLDQARRGMGGDPESEAARSPTVEEL